jgi:hypothetical protein
MNTNGLTLVNSAKPGTTIALPQRPLRSLTTKAGLSPAAAQFPGEEHDTELTCELCGLSAATPGTAMALPQRPVRSVTTKACSASELSV